MAQTNSSLQRWKPIFLSLLRIVVGLLFLEHGTQKLFHFPPPDHRMGMHGLTPLMTVAAGVVGPLQSPKTTASLLLAKLSGLLTIRAERN
jgi:uncharacterized membrane protein YphA (DoxX/SURF4 family)